MNVKRNHAFSCDPDQPSQGNSDLKKISNNSIELSAENVTVEM